MKFLGKVGNRPVNKRLNFGGDPDADRDTGKTCLGGGMHCPNASNYNIFPGTLIITQFDNF